jgi:signal transduction histidine kinase
LPRDHGAHFHTLNQELEQAGAQLAEANAIKDEFLAQVSHDLRTPLNSILSFTKMVLDGLCTNPEEAAGDIFSNRGWLPELRGAVLFCEV